MKLTLPLLTSALHAPLAVLALALTPLIFSHNTQAATLYWNGSGPLWNSTTNWSTAVGAPTPNPVAVPGSADTANFSIRTITPTAQTVNLNANQAAGGLIFLGTNTQTTLLQAGGTNCTLSLGTGGITVNSPAGAVTIGSATSGQNVAITLGGAQTWINSSANALTIQNAVTNGANLLTVAGTGNTFIKGVIGSGSGGLTKNGTGSVTLSGANTYTGKTTVLGGTLSFNSIQDAGSGTANALGTPAAGPNSTIDLAGTLAYSGANEASSNRDINLRANSSIFNSGTSTLTLSGNMTGSGPLTFRGGGGDIIASGIISTTGVVQKDDSKTLYLQNAANSFGSSLGIYSGTVDASSIADSYSNSAIGSGTTISLKGTAKFQFSGARGGTSNRAISLQRNGGTTANTWTLENTVSSQLLTLSGNVTLAAANGGTGTMTLALAGSGNGALNGSITGSQPINVTKSGTGTWTLGGANTYTGATTITAGTLSLSRACLADDADVNITRGAVLNLTFSGTDTIRRLLVNGAPQTAGVYGGIGSGAMFERREITGTGTLTIREDPWAFFKLFDLTNDSLITRNPSLGLLKIELAKTVPDYDRAKAYLTTALDSKVDYDCGLSRVTGSTTAEFARNFFDQINLDSPGLETTKIHVVMAEYTKALDAWRDYTVNKLRGMTLPALFQTTYKPHLRQVNIASYLLGEMNYSDYLLDESRDFYDVYGAPPSNPGFAGAAPYNWLNQPTDLSQDRKASYAGFYNFSSLVYRYYQGKVVAGGTGSDLTLSGSGTTVTATFPQVHGLSVGDLIRVTSASPSAYNGLFQVASVPSSKQITYVALNTVSGSATGPSRSVRYTREEAALNKWFEIASDFSTRQKNLVANAGNQALRNQYRTVYRLADWSLISASALSQGDRASEMVAAIAAYCKLLPEETPVDRQWYTTGVLDPISTPLAAEATKLIPSEHLARICLSLMTDYPEVLILFYSKPAAVPNQRLNGLNALITLASVLKEFKAAPALLSQTDEALTDFANGMFYPDGAMLERSPNYNFADAEAIRALNLSFGPRRSLNSLMSKVALFERTSAFMLSPLGKLPRMACYAGRPPLRLWQSPAIVDTARTTNFLLTNNRESFRNTSDSATRALADGLLDSGNRVPGATSVAFPYAGYYVMRKDWSSKSPWLYFANTPPGRGHRQLDQNGIQVTAFGRELLTTGGIPPYASDDMDPTQATDLIGFQNFLGEDSSFKCNTVAVDGRSQNEGGIDNQTVTTTTRGNPWLTSSEFDYVEGTYSAGYGGKASDGSSFYSPLLANGDSGAALNTVTHKRSVIFLRKAGMWLVTDKMNSSDDNSHSYRQIWNFPARAVDSDVTYVGFLPSEIFTDESKQTVYTSSSTAAIPGPDISLFHLGPQDVTYATYSGSSTPYLGWWGGGRNGLRLATKNVHAVFSGKGQQTLVTAIVPRDTGTVGPVRGPSFTPGPLSRPVRPENGDNGVVDVTFSLVNGSSVRFIQSLTPQTLVISSRTVTATTILNMTAADGITQKVLIIGDTNSPAPYAFTASTGGARPFTMQMQGGIPKSFSWTGSGEFLQASTSDPYAPSVVPVSGPPLPLSTHTFERKGNFDTLTWVSNPGKRYQVEWTDSLTNWSTGGQSAVISAIDTISSYSAPVSNSANRFYRVRQLP